MLSEIQGAAAKFFTDAAVLSITASSNFLPHFYACYGDYGFQIHFYK